MAMKIEVFKGLYAVCKCARMPELSGGEEFVSVTRTPDEYSVVLPEEEAPQDAICERSFRLLRIAGVLEFTQIGVLRGVLTVLGEAGVSVVVVSTYNTDYILVKDAALVAAKEALAQAGYQVCL